MFSFIIKYLRKVEACDFCWTSLGGLGVWLLGKCGGHLEVHPGLEPLPQTGQMTERGQKLERAGAPKLGPGRVGLCQIEHS